MATKAKSSPKKQQTTKTARTPRSKAYAPNPEELDAALHEETCEECIGAALNQLEVANGAVELLKRAAMCPFPMSPASALAAAHMIERQLELVREELVESEDGTDFDTP